MIKINKCGGSCNNINDPFAKLCVLINETRQIVWHENGKCICRLRKAICNSKQIWNKDKCRCECKEDLINKLSCDRGYIWNPSTCECECDIMCGIGEYLDYKNCVCRKSIINKLVEESVSVADGNKMHNNDKTYDDCPSCTVHVILFIIFLLISLVGASIFVYYWWYSLLNV